MNINKHEQIFMNVIKSRYVSLTHNYSNILASSLLAFVHSKVKATVKINNCSFKNKFSHVLFGRETISLCSLPRWLPS